ncbi:hypothetical protein [Nocardia sp. NPDC052566]|uniref:hypothetical protein n=1 Tax=Nocardia sp. NPDC052566 TaxID=3364330 RepID=UPI0037C94F55
MAAINFTQLAASGYLGITAVTVTSVTNTAAFIELLDLDVRERRPMRSRQPTPTAEPIGSAARGRTHYGTRLKRRATRHRVCGELARSSCLVATTTVAIEAGAAAGLRDRTWFSAA